MELRNKQQRIAANLPDMSPLMSAMSDEMNSLRRDAMVVSRAFNQMYYRNEFYMKTIDEAMESMQVAAREALNEMSASLNRAYYALSMKCQDLMLQVIISLPIFHKT